MASNKGFIGGALVGACVAGAALAGVGLSWPDAAADTQEIQARPPSGQFTPPPGAPNSFADIITRVSPAVVSISATGRPQSRTVQIPGLPPFQFGPGEGEGGAGPRALSAGSGFFIRQDGYIVTNNHVVEGAEEITVRLSDERELPARIVGRDEGTDLAVLKVEGGNFPFVSFATGARPRVGDWVIAVGNPFELSGTVTAGIVSAYGRQLSGDPSSQWVDYLQIDAPVNRGNSGGPTFDIYGRVIGVNTAIFSDLPTGGSVGIGFAIPAELADQVTRQLMASGRVERGYLGANVQTVTPDMAEALGFGERRGAVVAEVVPNTPAARAGLQPGDLVLSFNGRAIRDNTELTRQVAGTRAGETMRLEVLRAGRTQTINVRAGNRPTEAELNQRAEATPPAARGPGGPGGPGGSDPEKEGEKPADAPRPSGVAAGPLSVAPLDDAARRRLGPNVRGGVLITAVAPNSNAAETGLQAGAVILQVGGRPVNTPQEVVAAVQAARAANRQNILLLVTQDGQTAALPIRIDERPRAPTPPPATPPRR